MATLAQPKHLRKQTQNLKSVLPPYHCWALRNKVQDLIDAKEIQFEAPERPNVVTAPMPQHGVNVVEEDLYVASVEDIVTPLLAVKRNMLLAGLFPVCSKGCLLCSVSPAGCPLLKSGVQNLMDSREILFRKTVVPAAPVEEVSIVTKIGRASCRERV